MRIISESLNTAPRPLIVSTELYSLAINRFPWEAVFPQSRSLHIHCTKDMDSLPVMRSLTSTGSHATHYASIMTNVINTFVLSPGYSGRVTRHPREGQAHKEGTR